MAWLELLVKSTDYKISSLLFFSVIALLVGYLSYLYLKWQKKASIINRIPGPKTVPIFGNALELNTGGFEFFKLFFIKYCEYGTGLYRMWIGPIPACAIYNASGAEIILRSNAKTFLTKSPEYGLLHTWLGTGLLTSTGSKWAHHRRLLTPSFHFKILEDFIDVMNKQSSKFVANLEEKADGNTFNIFPQISLCTLDIIIETAMGTNINAQDNSEHEYVKAIHEAGYYVIKRFRTPWIRSDLCFKLSGYGKKYDRCLKVIHELSTSTIRDRRKEFQRLKELKNENKEQEEVLGKRKKLAFLDMLLDHSEENDALSDESIREEVDTFMFEGHDTTAAGVNWTIYLLGGHKEYQEKVFEELDAIFGDSDRPVTSDDLREMKYLECCIKEALRLFPSAPFIGRMLDEDVEIDGYTIPKGTGINILIYSIHRDPKYFPNPEEYNPERFFPENSAKRHPFAYIPFSAGPRNCIGQKFALMEEKIVLSTFFRKYKVESLQKREDLILLTDMILRPEDGTFVKLLPRK